MMLNKLMTSSLFIYYQLNAGKAILKSFIAVAAASAYTTDRRLHVG